jgi:histidyl-tRNA synthetase
MRDILPGELPAWERLEATARELARLHGFQELRTPLLEETELFTRSVGEVTDIVEKEMFTLKKGDTSLTLRPEGTAGICRAYLEAGWAKTAPVQRLWYVGPMFRYERPQKARGRMFTQFDAEVLGSTDPRVDAELVHLATSFLERIGLAQFEVRVNSMGDGEDRDRYREAVREFLAPTIDQHCELCRKRFERNVLRVLDCKNPSCKELHAGGPVILDYLSDGNRAHLEAVRASLSDLGRESEIDSSIVRGLDYYTRTIFEIHDPSLGARSALCGGGRYDHLLRELGGPDLPAAGFAIGFEPVLVALEDKGLLPDSAPAAADVFAVAADPDSEREVLCVADALRLAGVSCVYDLEGKSMKAQLKAAGRGGHRFAVLIGPDELERGVAQLKDLGAGQQTEVPRGALAEAVRRALAQEPR